MRLTIASLILALGLLVTGRAEARASAEYTYRYDQLWQATVRLLRVELGCQITDRDDEIGYVMFDYPGTGGRMHNGSAELVRTTDANGVERVRVTVTIRTMPSYIEHHVLTRLERKMREDFGLAPRVRAPRHEDPPTGEEPPSDTEPPSDDDVIVVEG